MEKLKILSLFSGVEGLGRTFMDDPRFEIIGFSENEKYASSVLKYHYPNIFNYGDIAESANWCTPEVDLIMGGFSCFAEGTDILTDQGFKCISEIKVGDMVWTHQNRFRPITKAWATLNVETVEIKAQGVRPTTTTWDHPYLTKVKRKGRNSRYFDESEEWLEVNALSKDTFLASPINTESKPVELSNSKLWMIGRFIADGFVYSYKRKGRKNSFSKRIVFCVGYKKCDEFEKYLDAFDVTVTKSPERTVMRYIITAQSEFDLFNQFGYKAHNKHFPNWILDLPVEQLKMIIKGYLSGDGYLTPKGIYKMSSVSPRLIYGLGLMVQKAYGVGISYSFSKSRGTTVIEGRTVNVRDTHEMQFRPDITKQANYHVEDGRVWYPLKKVTPTGRKETVYNFSVLEDESYVANNAIVHNCQGFSTQGKQTGLEHLKSGLFDYIPPLIKRLKPKYILLENVTGLLMKNMEKDFAHIKRSIEKEGYTFNYRLQDSSYYGTAQQRIRVFMLCVRKDIKQIPESDSLYGGSRQTKIKGNNGTHIVSYSKSTRKGHKDYRLRTDGLVNTLTTGLGCVGASTGSMVIKGNEVNLLPVNLCERLQTWPKNWTKYGIIEGETHVISDTKRYQMCGNGVASNVVKPFKEEILMMEELNK